MSKPTTSPSAYNSIYADGRAVGIGLVHDQRQAATWHAYADDDRRHSPGPRATPGGHVADYADGLPSA